MIKQSEGVLFDHAEVTLGHILDSYAGVVLDRAAGKLDRQQRINTVAIFSTDEGANHGSNTLVLITDLWSDSESVSRLNELDAMGVRGIVVPTAWTPSRVVVDVVEQSKLCLFTLSRGMTWVRAIALLQSILDTGTQTRDAVTTRTDSAYDLFALAESVSALVDAAITIEDTDFRVLAYSRQRDGIDKARIASVLDRRVPAEYVDMLESSGVAARLRSSKEPVSIPPGVAESSLGRLAVGIHAGSSYLGSLWVVVDKPMKDDRILALREAANMLAIHLMQRQMFADIRRRASNVRINALLNGIDGTDELFSGNYRTLILFSIATDITRTHRSDEADIERIVNSFLIHLTSIQPHSLVARIEDTVYGVLPTFLTGTSAERYARASASDYIRRVGADLGVVIGISGAVSRPDGMVSARKDADRARDVLQFRSGSQRIAFFADVYVDHALRCVARENAVWGHNPLQSLHAVVEAGPQYVQTLSGWFEAFGDVAVASAKLHIHPNTFRYRLRKVRDILDLLDIDINDADTRFRLWIQLRLAGYAQQRPIDSAARAKSIG